MKKSLVGVGLTATLVATPARSADVSEHEARSYSLYRFNSLYGTTGLLHTVSADSGAQGTFHLSYLLSFYSGSGFLCRSAGACAAIGSRSEDSASRHGEDIALSATLARYLELDLAVHSQSAWDDRFEPTVIQVLADTQLGLKAFTPRTPDRVFATGALGQLKLLGRSGSIGPSAATMLLEALGTLDLTNRSDAAERIPLRFNVNLGYLFDNSSSIAEKTERERGTPVTRFERFGLGINRVDSILIGIGGEFVHPIVQPFGERSMAIASNRQNYYCVLTKVAAGDDAESGVPVADSRVVVIDDRKRMVQVYTDASGGFSVQNVPVARIQIEVNADGFLPAASEVEIRKHTELHLMPPLRRLPKEPNSTATSKQLKFKVPLTFADGASADGNEVVNGCTSGLSPCGNVCVDLRINKNNCGLCGAICSGYLVCSNGQCACPAGTTNCNGTCTNLLTANDNCGGCGVRCNNGLTCQDGTCK